MSYFGSVFPFMVVLNDDMSMQSFCMTLWMWAQVSHPVEKQIVMQSVLCPLHWFIIFWTRTCHCRVLQNIHHLFWFFSCMFFCRHSFTTMQHHLVEQAKKQKKREETRSSHQVFPNQRRQHDSLASAHEAKSFQERERCDLAVSNHSSSHFIKKLEASINLNDEHDNSPPQIPLVHASFACPVNTNHHHLVLEDDQIHARVMACAMELHSNDRQRLNGSNVLSKLLAF